MHATETFDISQVVQTAFIVPDIRDAIATYVRTMKVGPWFLIEKFTPGEAVYRGKSSSVVISVAFAFRGPAMFELIEQHDQSPSVFREHIAKRGYGLHHLGIMTEAYDELLSSMGTTFECVFSARTTGRLAMLETADLPHLVEILELDPRRRQFFSDVAVQAAQWDGIDPVRRAYTLPTADLRPG